MTPAHQAARLRRVSSDLFGVVDLLDDAGHEDLADAANDLRNRVIDRLERLDGVESSDNIGDENDDDELVADLFGATRSA